jgi:hypothetical protein
MTMQADDERVWRPDAWLKAAGNPFSRPTLYAEIHAGRVDARKRGRSTIILTSPRAYFESLPKGIDPPAWRARKGGRRRDRQKRESEMREPPA